MQELEGSGKPARVLLVEDDARAAATVGEMLRGAWSRGLVIAHTPSVSDAAHELVDHGATCVLLSLYGDRDPVEALELLGSASPDTPIIVLGDRSAEEDGVAAVRAGAQDYLVRGELTAGALSRAVRYAVERKRAEVALAVQALHDSLTTLPNRALFLDRVRVALDRSRRTGSPVAVLFLDVDGFKQINDTLGHAAGDALLSVLADRFRGLLRPMDTVARYGGDEFTFLFEGLDGEHEAAQVADRISQSAALPLNIAGRQMSVSVSIGVSIVTDPTADIDEVIRCADTAMYRAKELGGARYEVFDGIAPLPEPTLPPSPAPSELERALREALPRSELRVHYQPRVSLDGETGLVGFEALVRWEHPERGLMAALDFIPIAEQTGLIVPIGEWVLEQALEQVRRWRESRPDVTISVNLSERQLEDAGLLERLMATLREGGHDPSVLCLEVPESVLAAEPDMVSAQLAALNEMGVTLAIDDFGTGRATRDELQQMPVHMLKLDRELVSRLGDEPGCAQSVSEAVELGHTLGLSVIAEGVETDAQLAQLRDLGCDGAQGFLFSRPLPGENVFALLGAH